jgi:hypothetical protein
MVIPNHPKVRAVGISWYGRKDYNRARLIMVDRHVLPPTFDEWRKKAGAQESEAKRKGFVVVRARIDPDKFLEWCREKSLPVDAKARTAFAAEVAMKHVKAMH